MRQVDKLPMIIRFVSDFIQIDHTMTNEAITDRAFKLADLIADRAQSEPEFHVNRRGNPHGEKRLPNGGGISTGGVRVWSPLR